MTEWIYSFIRFCMSTNGFSFMYLDFFCLSWFIIKWLFVNEKKKTGFYYKHKVPILKDFFRFVSLFVLFKQIHSMRDWVSHKNKVGTAQFKHEPVRNWKSKWKIITMFWWICMRTLRCISLLFFFFFFYYFQSHQ